MRFFRYWSKSENHASWVCSWAGRHGWEMREMLNVGQLLTWITGMTDLTFHSRVGMFVHWVLQGFSPQNCTVWKSHYFVKQVSCSWMFMVFAYGIRMCWMVLVHHWLGNGTSIVWIDAVNTCIPTNTLLILKIYRIHVLHWWKLWYIWNCAATTCPRSYFVLSERPCAESKDRKHVGYMGVWFSCASYELR